MRILAIGDMHGNLEKIKKFPLKNIDLILLTGDLGKADLARKIFFDKIKRQKAGLSEIPYSSDIEVKVFMEAFNSTIKLVKYLAKFAPVYLVYGNVEYSKKDTKALSKKIKRKLPFLDESLKAIDGVKILNKKLSFFKGINVLGLDYFIDSSWVKEFKPGDYQNSLISANKETLNVKKFLKKFKKADIFLCHQPPYGILDKINFPNAPASWQGKHAGSKAILDYIKKAKPSFVFCGHIHEAEGMKILGTTKVYNLGTAYQLIEIKN